MSTNKHPFSKLHKWEYSDPFKMIEFNENFEKLDRDLADRGLNVKWYGAVGNSVNDDKSAIQSALDAIKASGGGVVLLPPGTYKITGKITIPEGCKLVGTGFNSQGGTDYASTILKDGNFVGVEVSENAVLSNVTVKGAPANGGDGVQLIGGRCLVENVVSTGHGGNGFRVGTSTGNNCNLWRLSNILSVANAGHGVYIHDGAVDPNVNAGTLIGADIRSNSGSGLVVENAIDNTFVAVTSQENGSYGVLLKNKARGHQFYGTYVELNPTYPEEFRLDAGAENNIVLGFRSGIVASNIANYGAGNFIVERDDQRDEETMIKHGFNLWDLGIQDHATSGLWKIRKNPTTRDLEISLEGTSANASVVLKHPDALPVELKTGKLEINNGQTITDFHHRSFTVDIAPIATKAHGEFTVTVLGAVLGDVVTASPTNAPPAGLFWNCYVSAADTVVIRFYNNTAGTIDPTPQEWKFHLWRADSQ